MSAYKITVTPTTVSTTGSGANRTERSDNPHRDALAAACALTTLGHRVEVVS